MLAVAVRREAGGGIEPCLAARDQVEDACSRDGACQLRDPVGEDVLRLESPAGEEAERDGRIEVGARDVADGVGHRTTVSPKASDTPTKPMPSSGNAAARTALPHPPNTSQNVPSASATSFGIVPLRPQPAKPKPVADFECSND